MLALLPSGRTVLVEAAELATIPYPHLARWCSLNARYGLVTAELVEWLRVAIGGRLAIEVGAGQGDLGHHLGVPMSDSAVQDTNPGVHYLCLQSGNAPTCPPPDVERISANEAVVKYRPQVVVASWLTQLYQGEDRADSSSFGTDEVAIIRSVETYVHIGNVKIHQRKRALALPHSTYAFPWLWSRARSHELDRIWVWQR